MSYPGIRQCDHRWVPGRCGDRYRNRHNIAGRPSSGVGWDNGLRHGIQASPEAAIMETEEKETYAMSCAGFHSAYVWGNRTGRNLLI